MKPTNKGVRDFLEHSRFSKAALKVIGVVGVALIMSGMHCITRAPCASAHECLDGVLTPAQSVLGSIQGMLCPTVNGLRVCLTYTSRLEGGRSKYHN
jgi:KUP system potassium uptake protein